MARQMLYKCLIRWERDNVFCKERPSLSANIAGVWRPIEWSSTGAKILYNVFTSLIIMSEYFLGLTQFMDIILVVDNIDDFATNTLMFLTIISICCKTTTVVVHRDMIINIIQMLLNAPCKPQDTDEMAIQTKFDKFIKSFTLKYLLLVTCSVTGLTIRSVFSVTQGDLPNRVWLPYDRNVSLMFWITSVQQIVSVIFGAIINVGTETLIFGLILQTCVQLEIFESRLQKVIIVKTNRYLKHALVSSDKGNVMSECIRHHLNIYKYAKTVNVIFSQVLFFQFLGSIMILCTSVYYLAAHITLSESGTLIGYTFGMFIQIFIYCWVGNEVMLKSTSIGDTVYHMDWPSLSISERKEILMIMLRTKIPIKFTSSFLITLTLESYSNILKMSYSAFNILQK